MITIQSKGDFRKTSNFLGRMSSQDIFSSLDRYARSGVSALASATPVESGKTASSWGYEISKKRGNWTITWTNSHINAGVPIAIILQYGHGTGTGGFVAGRDYINPAIRPVFDAIAEAVWREVAKE